MTAVSATAEAEAGHTAPLSGCFLPGKPLFASLRAQRWMRTFCRDL